MPCGILAISGSVDYMMVPEDTESVEDVCFVKVSPGSYLAEVFIYLPSVNAELGLRSLEEPKELFGAYYRRTRPGQPFPRWLERCCAEDPSEDPGHKRTWEAFDINLGEDRWSGTQYIDLLLRLSPMPEVPPAPPENFYWFPYVVAPRKPAHCPLGLVTAIKPSL